MTLLVAESVVPPWSVHRAEGLSVAVAVGGTTVVVAAGDVGVDVDRGVAEAAAFPVACDELSQLAKRTASNVTQTRVHIARRDTIRFPIAVDVLSTEAQVRVAIHWKPPTGSCGISLAPRTAHETHYPSIAKALLCGTSLPPQIIAERPLSVTVDLVRRSRSSGASWQTTLEPTAAPRGINALCVVEEPAASASAPF
jgi:hypothetical protein